MIEGQRAAVAAPPKKAAAEERPRPLPESPSPSRTPQSMPLTWELFSDHPGYGLNPERIWRIFRCAEAGYPQQQIDLFEDLIENDGHLRSVLSSRLNAVAGKSWVVQPGAQDAASVEGARALAEKLSGSLNFLELIEHQLEAVPYGYAGSEIEWDFADRLFFPAWFRNVPHRRWVFRPRDGSGALRILTQEDRTGEELERGYWVISKMRHTNPGRAGLMRTAAWFAMFKRFSVRDWVIAAEKHGIPHVLGKYRENASAEARAQVEKAVKDLGEAGQAVLSELTEIVIHEAAQRSGDMAALHPSIVNLCEQQMSKLCTGSVLTADTGTGQGSASWALGKVHQNVRFDLVEADARRLGHVFRRDIGVPFMKWNGFPGQAPYLKLHIVQETDQNARMDIFEKAQQIGFPIDQDQVAEEIALRPAEEGGMQPREEQQGGAGESGDLQEQLRVLATTVVAAVAAALRKEGLIAVPQ